MQRVCEPELMNAADQARAYAEADFSASDQALVERIEALFGADLGPLVVDLGCGPGTISFRLADRFPASVVLGIDGAPAMLAIAQQQLQQQRLPPGRVQFRAAVLPCPALEAELQVRCTAVVSNSLLHHLHDPQVLWRTVLRLATSGAALYVQDLRRPADEASVAALVAEQMAGAPAVLRHDFAASLRAAFTPAEVEEQLRCAGLAALQVQPVGGRHLEIQGRLP